MTEKLKAESNKLNINKYVNYNKLTILGKNCLECPWGPCNCTIWPIPICITCTGSVSIRAIKACTLHTTTCVLAARSISVGRTCYNSINDKVIRKNTIGIQEAQYGKVIEELVQTQALSELLQKPPEQSKGSLTVQLPLTQVLG